MAVPHGYNRYSHGCRCEVCRRGKADYMRERRTQARRLAARHSRYITPYADRIGVVRFMASGVLTHGRAHTYEEHGCRCWPCTDAKETKRQTERQRRDVRGTAA